MDEEIFIKKMTLDDVLEMRKFQNNESPLLSGYNFTASTPLECKFWYYVKTSGHSNYFVCFLGNRVIGYVSMKSIDCKNGTSTLGIVLDPKYQGKGLGKKILVKFYNYYFGLGFKDMTLQVDFFNIRAQKLYESIGFKRYGRSYQIFYGDVDKYDLSMRKYFVFIGEYIFSKVYLMRLKKEDFADFLEG